MNKFGKALIAAVAVAVAVAGLSSWAPAREAWAVYVGDRIAKLFAGEITVTAHFRNSVGLYVGNEVTVLGMPVGKVTSIEPAGTEVVVRLAIADNVDIPADVSAVTVSPSVVTNRNVELTPAYRGGPKLADEAVIPLERTRTPVEIDRVIKAVDDLARELSKARDGGKGVISDALAVAARNLEGNGERIRKALGDLASAVESSTTYRDALVSLVREVDTLLAATAKNKVTISSFSKHLTTATELFAETSPALADAMKRLNGLLDETGTLVDDHSSPVRATLDNARTTSRTLASRTGDLAESIDVLPLTFQNMMRAVDPKAGELRVHVNTDQEIHEQYQSFCDYLGFTLRGCESRTLRDFGPDLGLSAMLMEVVRE